MANVKGMLKPAARLLFWTGLFYCGSGGAGARAMVAAQAVAQALEKTDGNQGN